MSVISIHASEKEATHADSRAVKLSQFQSTPPRRRRLIIAIKEVSKKIFQSTPPRRRRLRLYTIISIILNFNPRLREGGDFAVLLPLRCPIIFQSTPPRRRRLPQIYTWQRVFHFNPRLREGGDSYGFVLLSFIAISIHASEKEATS